MQGLSAECRDMEVLRRQAEDVRVEWDEMMVSLEEAESEVKELRGARVQRDEALAALSSLREEHERASHELAQVRAELVEEKQRRQDSSGLQDALASAQVERDEAMERAAKIDEERAETAQQLLVVRAERERLRRAFKELRAQRRPSLADSTGELSSVGELTAGSEGEGEGDCQSQGSKPSVRLDDSLTSEAPLAHPAYPAPLESALRFGSQDTLEVSLPGDQLANTSLCCLLSSCPSSW